MEKTQVFNTGSVKNALEQKSPIRGLGKKAKGPTINNSLLNRFASLGIGKILCAFNDKEYEIPHVRLPVEERNLDYYDEMIDMDTIIVHASTKHEKRIKQNFLFDRI